MPKYRPVEGRSIEDVKVGDFVSIRYGDIYRVIYFFRGTLWIQLANGHGEEDGFLADGRRFQIVEPIPEPKIEVERQWIYVGATRGEEVLADVTRTDGKITAVELMKDES